MKFFFKLTILLSFFSVLFSPLKSEEITKNTSVIKKVKELGKFSEPKSYPTGMQKLFKPGCNGFSCTADNLSKEMLSRFSRQGVYLEKYPGTQLHAMAMFEVFYQKKLKDGEDKIELEEAYVQTLKSYYGFSAKAGRFLATIGYLNEHHTHTDNFADRPLPYRAFLNKHFYDDGIEISYLFPTDFYLETGYSLFRGDSFPAAGAEGNGSGSQSGYLRIGSEIAKNLEYRIGFSFLNSKTGSEARKDEDENDVFAGDSDLTIADLKLSFSPVNNVKKQEVILQGEYFSRTEEGVINSVAGQKEETSGFYGEAIYKFAPKYRLGYRYSRLDKKHQEYTPEVNSFMFDYSNSEFSRIRVQYNADNSEAKTDNQYIFQYIMSIGAHPAHKF